MDTSDLLTRGVAEIIDQSRVTKRLSGGEKLRVKLGVDPNKPNLHLGHAVPLRKLREFQDAGHTAVLILGDYTAQLGDPSDKSEARKLVSAEETAANAEAYKAQAFKILDPAKTEIRHNSEWFRTFDLRSIIELMATTTVNHLMSHETFSKRIDDGQPLYSQELLYPLMQGYDSVMVKSDIELGGVDQKFNVLMGRVVQRSHNQNEQDILLVPYLIGTDGHEKMSKSLGNTVNLTDAPQDMFGKIMSIPDSLLGHYFSLATLLPQTEVVEIESAIAKGSLHPRDAKVRLAKAIVAIYHSESAADEAEAHFNRVFRDKQAPENMETLVLVPTEYELGDILVDRSGLVASKSELRRLVSQSGVKKNNAIIHDVMESVSNKDGEEVVLQVGSRRFLKITWKS